MQRFYHKSLNLNLYDLLPLFYHFIRTQDWGIFFYFTNRHVGSCIYLFIFIYIDRSTYRFTPWYISTDSNGINSYVYWPCFIWENTNKIEIVFWKDGQVVDSSDLENRYSFEQITIEGSNPSLSFFSVKRFFSLLVLPTRYHIS